MKKPVEPEGMGVETPEVMEKFIYYWNDLNNYAIQTGDTSEVRKYTSTEYSEYMNNFDSWDRLYLKKGWMAGGLVQPEFSVNNAQSLGDGYYLQPINYDTTDLLAVLDGKYETHKLSEDNSTGYALKLQFADDGNWYVVNQEVVGE